MNSKILVVDDEPGMLTLFREIFFDQAVDLETASSAEEALNNLKQNRYDLLIADIRLPKMSGVELMKQSQVIQPDLIVIAITGHATVNSAVECMKMGAYDYITKPFHINSILLIINKALERSTLLSERNYLRSELEDKYKFDNLIGHSQAMQDVFSLIKKVSKSDTTILIEGESGTGKELVARSIHWNSARRDERFVVVNCGALPPELLESELFGHIKGSFTGAIKDKRGLFEEGDKGTIFLDEIGEVPIRLQVKLLRALQEGEIKPVGSTKDIKVDVRVIAATNKNLKDMMNKGNFRDDLYYRLAVIKLPLPPLRERNTDIPFLINHFIDKYSPPQKSKRIKISSKLIDILCAYDWPGNVRELENVIERAIVLSNGETIELDNMPKEIIDNIPKIADSETSDILYKKYLDAKKIVQNSFTKRYLESLILRNQGNISKAAKESGIARTNLHRLLKQYKIDAKKKDTY